jgi:hypothetical protein
MDEGKGPGDAPPGVQRQIVTRIAITGYFSILCCEHVAGDFACQRIAPPASHVASWEEQATDVKMNT